MGYCSTKVITFCPVFVNSGAFQQPPRAVWVMDPLAAAIVDDEPTPVSPSLVLRCSLLIQVSTEEKVVSRQEVKPKAISYTFSKEIGEITWGKKISLNEN